MTTFLILLQDANGGLFGGLGFILPLLLMGGVFYFLVILPQKKQRQEMQNLISELKINDEIVTTGGIIGKIKEIRETSFIIQSAEKTFLEIGKSAVIGKKADPNA